MFPELAYLSWIEGRPAAAKHDLGSSDLCPVPGGEIVPEALAGLPEPPADESVESLLAARYDVSPQQVLVTPGASIANLVTAATALDGDDVLVETPAYEPLWSTPEALGATLLRFRRLADDDWRLDPVRVENAITETTGLVTVTNRHNPTGVRSSRETLQAVAGVARDAEARLLVDEVYGPYGSDDSGRGFGGPTAAGVDGAVTTGSLTKFYGLGGLQVGWLLADEPFVDAARRVAQHFGTVAGPSRALARRAIYNAETLSDRSRTLARANHRLLRAFVSERDALSGVVPDGSPYALLEHATLDGDAVHDAAADAGVLVVPGRFFGAPDGFRVALGRSPDSMDAALDALGAVLDGV